jgi:hypothetical protein
MRAPNYAVTAIVGLRRSDYRAIAILSCEGSDEINAKSKFEALDDKEMNVRSRFDHWIDGKTHDQYFHGWPNNAKYKECFVFKWRQKQHNNRFYGFLYHPKPKTNPRFLVCILVSHATKNQWETDPGELDGANALRLNVAVIAAIKKAFPDTKKGVGTTWLH